MTAVQIPDDRAPADPAPPAAGPAAPEPGRQPRLWYRLEDVLPMAEHAVNCYEHHGSWAVNDLDLSGPALIWDGTHGDDKLYSNGSPAWYSSRVPHRPTEHHALASVWRHTRTGRRGSPARAGGYPKTSAALLLDEPSGPGTLIDRLRAARNGRHLWIALDLSQGRLLTSGAVELAGQRGDLAPADATWVPAHVTVGSWESAPYPALVPAEYTTDRGLAIPRFQRPTVEKMIADFAALRADPELWPADYPLLRWSYEGHRIAAHTGDRTAWLCDLIAPDSESYYAVGTHQWNWTIADPAPGQRH